MPPSRLQTETRERLKILLNKYEVQENVHPAWLVNPETGHRLEIDLYLPDLKIGIEVQGQQHYKFCPAFHKTQADFEKQKARDDYKRAICAKRGVYLYEVFKPDDIDDLIEQVKDHHPDMYFELFKKNQAVKVLGMLAARVYRMHRTHPNPEGEKCLAKRIIHICTKYNIPVASVKPDFNISKVQMAFYGRRIVKIRREVDKWRPHEAAVYDVKDGTAMVKFYNKQINKCDEIIFDLATGKQLNGDVWTLEEKSIQAIIENGPVYKE